MPTSKPLDQGLAARVARHERVQATISKLSDDALLGLLSESSELVRNGHASLDSPQLGVPVFVKLLPLTDVEMDQSLRVTTNLFGLPLNYQYRLGSYGFGAWREVEAHELANRWVLNRECTGFALLHAWRVVPIRFAGPDFGERMQPWGDEASIRRRGSAIAASTNCVALVVERFPQDLLQHFLKRSSDHLPCDVWETEARLLEVLAHANNQGVLHMDAHLGNILTDGDGLYLADWGLALARTFDLDGSERSFHERHENYDRCTTITGLVHAVTSHLYPEGEDWLPTLRRLVDGADPAVARLSESARSYLAQRGPVAIAYASFYRRLVRDLSAEYPAEELQNLLAGRLPD